jgi:hypothetical protein
MKKRDLVLMWDKKKEKPGKHGKFDSLWLGPYKIEDVVGENYFYLNHLDGEKL